MDLTLEIENYRLNIRAAVIIKHKNKILVHHNIHSDHYALLGGRVQIGEDSRKTVIREVKEELGKEIEITGYLATIENFFSMKNSKYHEILFVYQGEFKKKQDKKIEETLYNKEGKEHLRYEWIPIEKVEDYPLKPEVIKQILREKQVPVHKINKEF